MLLLLQSIIFTCKVFKCLLPFSTSTSATIPSTCTYHLVVMESTSFYITLPSNASKEYYSNNTASVYQIRMPRTFYLKGKYEVALAEIQYPHTWRSVREDLEYFVCQRKVGDDPEFFRCTRIPVGYYKSMKMSNLMKMTLNRKWINM